MSTSSLESQPASHTQESDQPPENLLFKYPDADIVLCSRDSHHFHVPESYIVRSSPVLGELIQKALDIPTDSDVQGEASLPMVHLSESGEILRILLTFVFPDGSTPLLPPSTEKTMELLSVAQKYQMAPTLDHIRGSIMRQSPPSTQRNAALRIYSLAQEYGLHHEALQAAQDIILKHPMNIKVMVDLVHWQGPSLYELWKYYENFRAILKSDLTEFKTSGAGGTLTGLQCVEFGSSQIPRWLDDYIESIGDATNRFDVFEFDTALASHISGIQSDTCTCGSMPSQTIRDFWEALASVVHSSFKKVSD
jgi:hypothetical protein